MIIYNDFKKEDYTNRRNQLVDEEIIVNNVKMDAELVNVLNHVCKKWWYCLKLYKGENHVFEELNMIYSLGIKNVAVDAENYTVPGKPYMFYDYRLGESLRISLTKANVEEIILLPEDLGGERYKDYNKFVCGLQPSKILMERLYQQTEWWNMLYYYWISRIKYFFTGAQIYIGVWPENVLGHLRKDQLHDAKVISGDKIFWYSEIKSLPN